MPADVAPSSPFLLCLSGGGFRATFFHLGVVTALRKKGQLKDVRQIFAVSGGSILAAHMALNWERYTGSDAQFRAVVDDLAAFAKSDVRGRVIRRYACTFPFQILPKSWVPFPTTLTDHLERQYQRLFRAATFETIAAKKDSTPDVHVLTTNLSSGELCSFSRDGYFLEDDKQGLIRISENNALPLAYAVAASSAFPPLFPPVMLTADRLVERDGRMVYPHRLSDGGVFDNTAIEKALLVRKRSPEAAALPIVFSDASATFTVEPSESYTWPLGRAARASNILMRLLARSAKARLLQEVPGEATIIDIRTVTRDGPHNAAIQKVFGLVRTDLDWFSQTEIDALIAHGEATAEAALSGTPAQQKLANPTGSTSTAAQLFEQLKRAGIRRSRLFSWDDLPVSLAALAIVVGVPALVIASYVSYANEVRAARSENATTNRQLRNLATANARLTDDVLSLQGRISSYQGTQPQAASPPRACRHPTHGVERYARSSELTARSGWRSGGYSLDRWCDDYIAILRSRTPDARFDVAARSEEQRSRCLPFNCPEYNYSCTVTVASDPVYNERSSAACDQP